MKTIIKLLVVLAVLNALVRAAGVAWSYYQFKDAVEQSMIFGGNTPVEQLHRQVLAKAEEFEVPVTAENVTVQREGPRTWADVAYTHTLEYFPRFTYPVEFRFTVQGLDVAAAADTSR